MTQALFHADAPNVTYRFEAFQVCPDSRELETDFLYMIASLETHSDHPIAKAIVEAARVANILPVSVSAAQYFAGRGMGGLITLPKDQRPRAALIGSRAFLQESGLEMPELLETTVKAWEGEPERVVVFGGWDKWIRGIAKLQRVPIKTS
jgi:cation transport ATPase